MDAVTGILQTNGPLLLWSILAVACLVGGICSVDRAVTKAINKSRCAEQKRCEASWPWK